jgi:hypothetical protein
VVALPVYGLLVFLSTLTHQPDYRTDFHAYAEFVTTTSFLVSHLVGSILGTTIGIFGVLALGAVLAATGERRLAERGLVLSVAGMAFIMACSAPRPSPSPPSAGAYLAGQQAAVAVNSDLYGAPALIAVVGLAVGVAQPVGAVLLIISGAWIASTVRARPVGPRAPSQAHG